MKKRFVLIVLAVFLFSTIAAMCSGCALGIIGLSGYDYDPISAEEKEAQVEEFGDETVYWTNKGERYHLYEDCNHLDSNEELLCGTVEQAIEAGKESVCKTCEKQYETQNNHD